MKGGDIVTVDSVASTVNVMKNQDKGISKNDFLRLFITQLRFQDPLNPLDSTGMTAQLAQFSSLEELQNIHAQMNDLLLFQNSLQNTMAISLIGKRVKFGDEGRYGIVTGLTFENNITYLILDSGDRVQLGDIKEIGGV
jgi:flagellar basal-body rod modification protein FlgD